MDTDDMSDVHLDIVNIENAVSIDFDFQTRRIFYSDVNVDKIFSADFDGTNLREVIGQNLVSADGIAVDWVAKNLYFTDTGRNVIEVCRLNGSYFFFFSSDSLNSANLPFFVKRFERVQLSNCECIRNPRYISKSDCGFGSGRTESTCRLSGQRTHVLDRLG
jgi:hypothetical protein